MTVKIYHNPRCSKSRATLSFLERQGVTPEIIAYLDTPPTSEELASILIMLGLGPRDIMRRKEAPYKELGLSDENLSDDALILAMVNHPILIERPIVVNDDKAVLGRPPEKVLDILVVPQSEN